MIVERMHCEKVSYPRIATAAAEPVSTIHGKIWRLKKRSKEPAENSDRDALLTEWIKAVKKVRSTWGVRRVRAFLVKKCGFSGLGRSGGICRTDADHGNGYWR